MEEPPATAPLDRGLRWLLGLLAALAFAVLAAYWIDSPSATTVTTTYDRTGKTTSSSRRVQDQRSDGVVLGLLGLGTVLGLTAISGGQLKFTGPGGVGAEAIAAVGAAGQSIGELSARSGQDDPQVQAALARWEDVLKDLRHG